MEASDPDTSPWSAQSDQTGRWPRKGTLAWASRYDRAFVVIGRLARLRPVAWGYPLEMQRDVFGRRGGLTPARAHSSS